MTAGGRVVAVLGYSGRHRGGLHPICARRLAHAERLADGARAVILSGLPEAALMRAAWTGPAVELVCDPDACSTVANVRNVAAAARFLGATELVVVTSRWHRARVRVLLAAALRRSGIRVTVDAPPGLPPTAVALREAACLAVLPLQLVRVARNRAAA